MGWVRRNSSSAFEASKSDLEVMDSVYFSLLTREGEGGAGMDARMSGIQEEAMVNLDA